MKRTKKEHRFRPFTAEEIAMVKAAIQRAKDDMKEWRRLSYVRPERMSEPISRL